MQGRALPSIIIIILLLTGCASNKQHTIELPTLVGPHLYEIYTDASLYITAVRVNGVSVPLSNAEGNGVRAQPGFYISGPVGYQNRAVLNGWMHQGKNQIEVEFIPSAPIQKYTDKPVIADIARIMQARVVISRGRLQTGSLGLDSEELDKVLEANRINPEAEILFEKNITGISANKIMDRLVMEYELNTGKDVWSQQAALSECELDTRFSPNSFTGDLYLNGKLLRKISYNRSRLSADINKVLRNGTNEFELVIEKLDKPSKILLQLECSLETIVDKYKMDKKYPFVRYGDFFNKRNLPLLQLDVDKPATFSGKFEMKLEASPVH